MPNFDGKLSNVILKGKKEEIETYEADMKILIKKIKIKNDKDFYNYKTMLFNKEGIFKIINHNDYIYIYYDININIDELFLDDIKEIVPEGYCEPINKIEIEDLLNKENSMCKIKFKKNVNNKLENCTGSGFF